MSKTLKRKGLSHRLFLSFDKKKDSVFKSIDCLEYPAKNVFAE